MSEGNKKDTTKTLLPYAAIGVAGLYLYKKYGEGVQGAFGAASGVVGSMTETVNNITESIIDNNTLNEKERADIEQEAAAFTAGSAPGVKLPKLDKESQKLISKYSDDKKKVKNTRSSPYLNLNLELGPDTTPQKRSMQGLDEDGLKRINQVIKEGKLTQAEQAGGLTHVNTNSKPRIVKNEDGMSNKEAQKQGLSPMAWRGNTNSSGGSSKNNLKKNTNSSGGSSKNNLKKPRIVKNEDGMSNKEAQKQGLSPMAWRGNTNSSGGSSKNNLKKNTNSSGGSSKNNLKKPRIVKNEDGMSNKEAQKQGLSPMAWRGI